VNKLSRRDLAGLLAVAATLPNQAQAQAAPDTNKALAEALSAVKLPDTVEPAEHFRA